MKRSFRLRIFVHVVVITLGIILLNRFIAQNFLHGQLAQRVQQEMGAALLGCAADVADLDRFMICQRKKQPGNLTNSFFEVIERCADGALTPQAAPSGICAHATQGVEFWKQAKTIHDGKIQVTDFPYEGQRWWGVRQTEQAQGAMLWVSYQAIDGLVKQLWDFRDRNLVFVFPVLLLMLILLSVYLVNVLMRPVVQLEKTLSHMTSNNLGEASQLHAPYREFEKFVSVFEDLRVRLSESFTKARRFAADAAHELRTPLTIMRGNAEHMMNELPAGSKSHASVSLIGEEVERLIDITEKLLLLSRADGQSMVLVKAPFDLTQFLALLIEDGEPYPNDLKVTSSLQPGVVWICDAALARQLIHNLFANAIKYNMAAGWLHVDLKLREGRIVLTISNSAADIPADLGERGFDRFYRGNTAHSRKIDGQGLGLSLALEIAKVHQGRLQLATTKDSVSVTLEVPQNSET